MTEPDNVVDGGYHLTLDDFLAWLLAGCPPEGPKRRRDVKPRRPRSRRNVQRRNHEPR